MNKRVKDAFFATPLGSLLTTLQMRNRGTDTQSGSVFRDPVSLWDLIDADWEQYNHPNILAPAVGFKTPIPGTVGVVPLDDIIDLFGPAVQLTLIDGHMSEKNPQGSGFVECCMQEADLEENDNAVSHTTLLLGSNTSYVKCGSAAHLDPDIESCSSCDKGLITKKVETVWTFFPGDPILPSKVNNTGLHGKAITGAVAREMGFQYVKVTPKVKR